MICPIHEWCLFFKVFKGNLSSFALWKTSSFIILSVHFILTSSIKKVKKSRRKFTRKYFRKLPKDKSSRRLTTPILNGSVLPCVAGESGKQQWCHGPWDPSPRSGRTNRIRANKPVGSAPNCLWREYDFPLLIVHSLFLWNTRPYWLWAVQKTRSAKHSVHGVVTLASTTNSPDENPIRL